MDAALIASGSLFVLAAVIHGGAGEAYVVRRLFAGQLPSTPFGDARMTKTMVHVTWHFVTITFLTFGVALVLSGSLLEGDAARGISRVVAAACTAFWAIALVMGAAYTRSARFVLLHPAPVLLTVLVAIVWWGAL